MIKRSKLIKPLNQRFAPRPICSNVIAIDVDGTLRLKSGPNEKLIAWCRQQKESGKTLMLWSARGETYAHRVAEFFQVAELFDVIIGKPEAIVDDKGWNWIRFSRVVPVSEFEDD